MATRPFIYKEYHFECSDCGRSTVGMEIDGSYGHGWDKPEARTAARFRHEKSCTGKPVPVEESSRE